MSGLIAFFRRFFRLKSKKSVPKQVGVLLVAAGANHTEIVPMPVNFDLDAHLQKFPPSDCGFPQNLNFHAYKVNAFFFQMTTIAARNSDLIDEKGYVPIHMATVKNSITDIHHYITYLANTGVIDVDMQYSVGGRSRGYKWAEKYEKSQFIPRQVHTRFADNVHACSTSPVIGQHPYLFHWYAQKKLAIDPRSINYAFNIKELKMTDKTCNSWDKNSDTGKFKYPPLQYQALLQNIGKLQLHQYEAHIDNNVHRLHSVLTNMQKEYRNFVTYDGSPLVSIDIKNSQPYLTCLILKPEFWQKNSPLPINFHTLPPNVQALFTSSSELQKKIASYFAGTPKNTQKYVDLAINGGMYEEIAKVAQSTLKTSITRKEAKTLMFNILFASNRGSHKRPLINDLRKIFQVQMFPDVGAFFKIIKQSYSDSPYKKQHARLPIMLQAIESHIVLHICCQRIWNEKKQTVPIFTIHDSIVTTQEHVAYVQQVMDEEFGRCVGSPPKFSMETWDLSNLDPPISIIQPEKAQNTP